MISLVAGLSLAGWLLLPGRSRPGDERAVDTLRTLPYVTWTEVSEEDLLKNGVVTWDQRRTSEGINLFSLDSAPGALLLDMAGNRVLELHDRRDEPSNWKLIEPAGPDTFTVLDTEGVIFGIDARSRISWTREGELYHHDFHVDESGNLWAVDRVITKVPEIASVRKVWNDHIVKLSPAGERLLVMASSDLIQTDPALVEIQRNQELPPLDLEVDAFHTNTIWTFPADVVRDGRTIFHAGDVMICWRSMNTVAVIDPVTQRVRWHWGAGELDRPHHPTLVDNGNLLMFDNGKERGWSRVVEVDPVSGEIVWEYRGDPKESFYSSSRGGAQRLPNGNTLITDSMKGRVLEVTPEGETVWEYFESRTRKRFMRVQRATIYRMMRIPQWPLEEAPAEGAEAGDAGAASDGALSDGAVSGEDESPEGSPK